MSTTGPSDDERTDFLTRFTDVADRLEFPARVVGGAPRGDDHTTPLWGIHFRTDRSVHLGSATVHAGTSGSFDAVLGEYDGEDRFDPIVERTVDVDEGRNRIELDMSVEPGEYLLARAGEFPLRRAEWDGWTHRSRDGLELIGGSKPGDFEENRQWYYFFELSVAVHADAHLERDA